jgi:hypothetical protein
MITPKRSTRFLALLISSALVAAPAAAQQSKTPAPPKETTRPESNAPAPTLDTLLAADSYKVYGEIRNFGQVIRSGSVSEILDPIMKLAGPPKEFKSLVKFANAHAETLTSSRVLFAAWPARARLPQFLMAIEFASPDDARKFEPQLNEFLPKLLPPPTPTPTPAAATASPTPASSPQASPTPETEKKATENKPETAVTKEETPAPPQFVIKQSGNLVFISDTAFTFKNLRPKDSRLLAEDPNFRQMRDRFATEPLFLYFDIALEDKNRPPVATNEPKQVEVVTDMNQKPGEEPPEMEPPEMMPDTETPEPPAPVPQPEATLEVKVSPPPGQSGVVVTQDAPPPVETFDPLYYMLMGSMFGGQSKYPDAVGVAISFDSEGYAVRVLLINGPDAKSALIPFIPQLISGPSLVLESPSVLPADTEFFVAASLDAPQIYDRLVKAFNESFTADRAVYRGGRVVYGRSGAKPPEGGPFASLEKQLGIKIKDDLLPVLGNEIAVSLPVSTVTGKPDKETPPAEQTSGPTSNQNAAKKRAPSPVILISVKDKQAARALLPRIIDSLGFKGASTLAQTERRGDTEIVSYANALAYAFIGDFFVFSTDVAATRHIVDSYVNHQTLASDTHFRNFTRWQPRQVLGQVYVSPALMDSYRSWANDSTTLISDATRDFLLRLSPTSEPVTYALSNDGVGSLHELHVPKNLVLMAVAGISAEANQSPLMRNESMARGILYMITSSEERYRHEAGKGSYTTLDQLIAQGMLSKDMLENNGYKIELTVSGDKFEATAVPTEYGKTGKLSYFVDQTGIVRGGDHGGGPATAADRPVQ